MTNEELYNKLRDVRNLLNKGHYKGLNIDFADDLVAPMNNWDLKQDINFSPECKVHLYRSAINPFGRVAVCDLTAEPHFSRDELTLGYVNEDNSYEDVIVKSSKKKFEAKFCSSCMPGQRAINALWSKVLKDRQLGIDPKDQPLLFKN